MENLSRRAFIATALTGVGVATFTLATPMTALADPTSADVQAQADAERAKLADWQAQLDKASNDYYAALSEHDAAVSAMNDAQARIDTAQAQLATDQAHLGTRATSMYKNGNSSLLDMLLGSTSWSDLINTWDFLKSMNAADAAAAEQAQASRDEAQSARDEYSRQERIAADKLAQAEATKDQAEGIVQQYNSEIASLDSEVAKLVADEQAMAAAQAAAQAALAAATPAANDGGNDGGNGGDNGGGGSSGGGSDDYVYHGDASGVAAAICAAAQSQLGVPYVWGGESPGRGLDCSGLTQYCYACAGISIPHYSYSQASTLNNIPLSQAQPGDILYCGYHVAIYMGDGQYIHAPQTGDVVRWSSYMSMWNCALTWR